MGNIMIRSISVLLSLAISLSATIINVPADQATIQAGIDVAVDGDTVLVHDGVYNFNENVIAGFGISLHLAPGIIINGYGHNLQIYGILHANGSNDSMIVFNNVEITPGFDNSGQPYEISLKFCVVRGGSFYTSTGHGVYGSIRLEDSKLYDIPQIHLWYPVANCFLERNVFNNAGRISVGTSDTVKVWIQNNFFYYPSTIANPVIGYAVENWASYSTSKTIVQYNTFANNDKIAVSLPSGYDQSSISAPYNYWSSTDVIVIENMIYDHNDDDNIDSTIDYSNYLFEPDAETPDGRDMSVLGLDIGGNEDLEHLISTSPEISFSYYNSLNEPMTYYQIQVSSFEDFTVIDMWDTYTVVGSDTTTQYNGNLLVDGERYFLRMKVASGEHWSDWSQVNFRMNSIPLQPILLIPSENEIVEDVLLTIQNSSDDEFDNLLYRFYIYDDITMLINVDSSDLILEDHEVTSWNSTVELGDNRQYWWSAKAFDGFEYSLLPTPSSFFINAQNTPPEMFEAISPLPGATIDNGSVLFSWFSARDIDPGDTVSYSLYLDTPAPGVLVFDAGTDTSLITPEPLQDNTVFFWKVVACDLAGFETESSGGYESFIVNELNDNPSIVELITPDSVNILTLTPEMYWTAAFDIDPGDVVSYEMHWWGDGIEFDSVLTDTNAAFVTSELEDNTQYFWEVIAMDQTDGISHSEVATFWTDLVPEAPGTFALLSPEDDVTGLSDMPSFEWELAEDPDPMDFATYIFQISTDSSFTDLVFETNTEVDVVHEMTEALPADAEYWWRVIATDTDSLTTESETFKFTVGYVSIAEAIALPTEYILDQNFPNPFNPSTTLRYGLPEDAEVSLVIYDIRGNTVRTIDSGSQVAGWYEHTWNGMNDEGQPVSTGLYLTRLRAGSYTKTIKMLYLK
jgi:hypothetical protein